MTIHGGDGGGGSAFSRLTALGFACLTFNSGMAIHRSNGDARVVAFVASSYVSVVLLFYCLRWYDRELPGSVIREKLKVAIWTLTTLLAIPFSYKIAISLPVLVQEVLWVIASAGVLGGFLPVLVQEILWVMASAGVLGGFYAFFMHVEEEGDAADATLFPNERINKVLALVLAALRWSLPRTAGGTRAQDPRDIAWSAARFIVDSGATSHAVGNVLLLEDFQPYCPPRVATLADGSNLHILGLGRVQREGFSIPNVSLVVGLQNGLISTYQLDSEHRLSTNFSGNGVCIITQADGTEVGGAIFDGQIGGYVLRYLEVPGPAHVNRDEGRA